jgi:tol-pal system protein YbgF
VRLVASLCVVAAVLGGCALKGDVRRVESQLLEYREETARADSARAVTLARLLDELDGLQRRSSQILDSLTSQRQAILAMQGSFRGELTLVQQQLVTIQELTGQSQSVISQLRTEISRRETSPAFARRTPQQGGGQQVPSSDDPGPEEMFTMGQQFLNRGAPQSARAAFRRLLELYPQHGRAADALYWIGESFRNEDSDSAAAAFEQVVEQFPGSDRAPLALYKMGLDAERRGDMATARLFFQRVVAGYPRSDEANLARAKLNN